MTEIKIKGNYICIDGEEFLVRKKDAYGSIEVRYPISIYNEHLEFRIDYLEDLINLAKLVKDKEFVELYKKLTGTVYPYEMYRGNGTRWIKEVRDHLEVLANDEKFREEFKKKMKKSVKVSESLSESYYDKEEKVTDTFINAKFWDALKTIKEYSGDTHYYIKTAKNMNGYYTFIIIHKERWNDYWDIIMIDNQLNIYKRKIDRKIIATNVIHRIITSLEKGKLSELVRYMKQKSEKMSDSEKEEFIKQLWNVVKDIKIETDGLKWLKNRIAIEVF